MPKASQTPWTVTVDKSLNLSEFGCFLLNENGNRGCTYDIEVLRGSINLTVVKKREILKYYTHLKNYWCDL